MMNMKVQSFKHFLFPQLEENGEQKISLIKKNICLRSFSIISLFAFSLSNLAVFSRPTFYLTKKDQNLVTGCGHTLSFPSCLNIASKC